MGWFGDILGAVLPIAGGAFLGPLGAAGGSLLGGAINGGGSGGGLDFSSLVPYLSGAATAQRIPGQTTPGSYTPEAGGYGTYNYIPTGAEQLDPTVINQILASISNNAGVTGRLAPGGLNDLLLTQATSNPFTDSLTNAARNAGVMSDRNAVMQQDWGTGLANSGGTVNDMYRNLMGRAGSNPFTNSFVSGAQTVGDNMQREGAWLSAYTDGGIQNLDNPFYGRQMQGAQTAGSMLQGAGMDAFNKGAQFSGTTAAGLPAAMSILNTAFDPQTALYNKTATHTNDQLAAYLARSGLTNSGAGAGIASDALSNFNINWQNNQLGRQNAGLTAFANAVPALGNSLGQGANLQTTGAGNVAAGAGLPANTLNQQTGARFDLSARGSDALAGANALALGGAQAPYSAYDTTTADYAKYLGQYANALPSIGGALTGGSNLLNNSVQSEFNAGAIPYNATDTINRNNQSSFSNYLGNVTAGSNLSNQGISQIMDYLRSVMQGSQVAGNNASGAQGRTIDSNANAAAAINPLISGGVNGLSSLLGRLLNGSNGYGGINNWLYPSSTAGSTNTTYGNQIFG